MQFLEHFCGVPEIVQRTKMRFVRNFLLNGSCCDAAQRSTGHDLRMVWVIPCHHVGLTFQVYVARPCRTINDGRA